MHAHAPTDGFTAACEVCGAPAQFTLGAPVPPCAYCRAASPLSPQTLQRLHVAARNVVKAAASEHRRLVSAQRDLSTAIVMAMAGVGLVWLILGGVGIYACVDSITDHTGLISALTDAEHAKQALEATWILASMLGAMGLAFSAMLLAIARLRAQIAPPLALPPLPGGAYRCHLCGAGLDGAGALRTCRSCGAKNLIDGRVLKQHVDDLLAHIADLQTPLSAANEAMTSTLAYVSAGSSLVPIMIAPLVGVVAALVTETWYPTLNLVWMGGFVPGLFALCYLLLKGRIPVRVFEDTRLGDEIRVDGNAYQVVGLLHLPASSDAVRLPETPLRLLRPVGSAEVALAVHLVEMMDAKATAFRVRSGGLPVGDPAALARAPAITVELQPGVRAAACWLPSDEDESIRVVAAGAPQWTLEPLKLSKKYVFVP